MECVSQDFGLMINRSKTKMMVIDRAKNNSPEIIQIANCEVVQSYVYLGALITNNGGCSKATYFHRINGFAVEQRAPAQTQVDANDVPVGGLFAKLAKQQGGPPRLPAFPVMLDMSSTKTLLAISRVGRGGRSRRKRVTGTTTEHSPLDLSAAGESAAKRARLSASPSTRSDGDERASNEDRSENRECLCAEARARLSAWCVDEVCDFVSSIDICAEYASNFREQRIDGAGLPLLTEEHLTVMLQMKLGPALKLRAVLARRLEPCTQCQAAAAAANTTPTNTPKINGTSLKSEPRSNTTSPS
ncbi:jg11278 [Pararge aegeria aegeria]|uniref:Jg11278 protein n=1 Tax=Pararge aegeria aegeria TaxID=348720 RepID=A0A8S4RI47_9NEOP|nr:jg11278 [Pararge aegeria aegeria]